MFDTLLQLCALSVSCGAILCIIPDGGCRNVSRILCTAVLIICILEPLVEFDFDTYAVQSALVREHESAFAAEAKGIQDELTRSVIEQRYEEYILDKALELGISDIELKISTVWDVHEIWVPYSIELSGAWDKTQRGKLETIIRDDLGIPVERQFWNV